MSLRPAAALIGLVLAVMLTLREPFLGALFLVACLILRDALMVETNGSFFYWYHGAEVLYIATLVTIFLTRTDRLREFLPRNLIDWGMLGFMLALLVSGMMNDIGPMQWSYNRYINLFYKSLVLYFIVSRLTDTERRVLLLALVIIGCTTYLAYKAWRKSRTGELNPARPYYRTLFHDFALQLILTFPIIASLLTYRKLRWYLRLALFACLPLYALVVMRTKSRSSYLGLGVSLVLLAWTYRRRWPLMLLATPVLIFAITHQTPQVQQRLESIWTHETPAGKKDLSIDSRFRQMRTAYNVFSAHPLVGIGPRRFLMRYLDYAKAEDIQYGQSRGRYTMHCVPLLILAEEGLAGFLTYYTFIVGGAFLAVRETIRRARGRPELRALGIVGSGCFLGMCAWMAYSLTAPALTTSNIYATLALVWAARHVARARAYELAAAGETPEAAPAAPPPGTTQLVFT